MPASFIYGTALFGSTYLLPVYLQMALGISAALGQSLTPVTASLERLSAFNESFLILAAICATVIVAAWQLRTDKNATELIAGCAYSIGDSGLFCIY